MDKIVENKLNVLIAAYNKLVKGINAEATLSSSRAYGGIIRAGKGKLVESMAANLVEIAWVDVLHQDKSRLRIDKKKMPMGIKHTCYINRISNPTVKKYVRKHRSEMIYKFGTDVHAYIDGNLVLPVECKAFAENSMIKRILFDACLMKEAVGIKNYYLLQLESQLGGDYSQLNEITYGSPATHALLSRVNINLEIITLLKGERKIKEPIHKAGFYKELKIESLEKALNVFAKALERFVK